MIKTQILNNTFTQIKIPGISITSNSLSLEECLKVLDNLIEKYGDFIIKEVKS